MKLGPKATAFLEKFVSYVWEQGVVRVDILLYCSGDPDATVEAFDENSPKALYRVLTLRNYAAGRKGLDRVVSEGDYPDGARLTYQDGNQRTILFPRIKPEDEQVTTRVTERIIREVLNEPAMGVN